MNIKALIANLKGKLIALIQPDIATIITNIQKTEKHLERVIGDEMVKLYDLRNITVTIERIIMDKNKQLDAAYKVLNNISKVMK